MFTTQQIKSNGPKGEVRLTKNTPITLPINPSTGKRMHIPTINSATRNCSPRKLIGWNIYNLRQYREQQLLLIMPL